MVVNVLINMKFLGFLYLHLNQLKISEIIYESYHSIRTKVKKKTILTAKRKPKMNKNDANKKISFVLHFELLSLCLCDGLKWPYQNRPLQHEPALTKYAHAISKPNGTTPLMSQIK